MNNLSLNTIAVVVPAHNEGVVILNTLNSLLKQVKPKDIYVVDDGSTDDTASLAQRLLPEKNVLTIPNSGKADALNFAIKYFRIPWRYQYLFLLDADTMIDKDFIKHGLTTFSDSRVDAVVGKVMGIPVNWLTAYRTWEYAVGQAIHKRAQSYMQAIMVCSGCATIYKAALFKKLTIPNSTQAEDMDFTFLLHRHKYNISYNSQAVVYTQDPHTIGVYSRQLSRWYTGFWQCLIKHHIPWGGQPLDFEVSLQAVEGLYNGLLTLAFLIAIPLLFWYDRLDLLLMAWGIDIVWLFLTWGVLAFHNPTLWKILPYFWSIYVLRFLNSMIFLWSFVKITLALDLNMQVAWNTTRYLLAKSPIWSPHTLKSTLSQPSSTSSSLEHIG